MNLDDFVYTEREEYKDLMNIFQIAKTRECIDNKHKHHIVPRHCFNKYNIDIDNSSENLIYLSIGEHCLVHYYYSLLGKEKWFIEANNSSWKMLMKMHLGEVYEECKDNIVLMKLYCDTIDKKEYTYKSYERSDETKRKNGDANRGKKNGMYGKCGEKHPFFGKHHNEDARKKMSEKHRGRVFYFVETCKENKWTGIKILEESEKIGITLKALRTYLKKDEEFNYLFNLDIDKIKELRREKQISIRKKWFETHQHPMLGVKQSEESRKKMSENGKGKNKGKKMSEETKRKLIESHKGKKMSEESKEKNRIAHLGKVSKKKIKVMQFSTDMVFIKEWDSATDVEKELGFFSTNISKCCLGKRKSAYGYIWRFE